MLLLIVVVSLLSLPTLVLFAEVAGALVAAVPPADNREVVAGRVAVVVPATGAAV